MVNLDELDIPIDVVLEGDFAGRAAPPRPATAAARPSTGNTGNFATTGNFAAAAVAVSAPSPKSETQKELLERLLGQVRDRRRSAA